MGKTQLEIIEEALNSEKGKYLLSKTVIEAIDKGLQDRPIRQISDEELSKYFKSEKDTDKDI